VCMRAYTRAHMCGLSILIQMGPVTVFLYFLHIVMSDDSRGLYPNTLFVGEIPCQVNEEELRSSFPGCVSATLTEGYKAPNEE